VEQQYITESADEIIEIVANGSEPIAPRTAVTPILSAEEQALADAVMRYQIDHRRSLLNWRDIFEIVRSLGYRKVEPPGEPGA
jgi:hypothetical protein